MGVLVRSHAAKFNALHRCRRLCVPLSLWRRRLCLRLLLLLQWRQYVVGRGWCVALLLCQHARHASVDVRAAGVNPAQGGPQRSQLVLEKLTLLLRSPTEIRFRPQTRVLGSSRIMCSTQVLDVLDGFHDVSGFELRVCSTYT